MDAGRRRYCWPDFSPLDVPRHFGSRWRQPGAICAGDPGRDPRGWTVTVAFLAQTDAADVKPTASDDAADVKWFLLSRLPKLAFDHAMILERAKARLIDRKP